VKHKGLLIRGLLGLCLLAALFAVVDFRSLVLTLRETNHVFSLIVILLVLCDRVFMAFKWNVLLRAIGIRISFLESVRTYFASSFAGVFLPTSVGADVLRLFIVDADKGRREGVAASIVVERLLGFMALVLLFIIMATCAMFEFSFTRLGIIIVVALVIFAVSAWLFQISLYHVPVSALDRFKGKAGDIMRRILTSYQMYKDKRRALVIFFALSFVEHFLPIACNYFTGRALGIELNPLAFFVVIPIILLFARLPISVDGIGVHEGLYWALFQMAGVYHVDALAMGVLARILTTVSLLPGGVLLVFHHVSKRRES
jgi:glycosyltransferase 2 family protein